ncbi:MAG: hypothetical protein GXZ02_11790 [Clostridiales bacterium]|nr:hypothetical protein [Clostridiales bacterium]
MVGYIKAYKPELKVKDYEVYKGLYCSLCKQLRKSYSPFAQLFLSYDFAFLLVLKMAISSECPAFEVKRCHYNPLVKCNCCNNEEIALCADLSVIISYYKVKDNIRDSKTLKKITMYLFLPIVGLMHNKAKRRIPDFEKAIAEAMFEQARIEENQDTTIDKAAEPTARALSAIFSMRESDAEQKAVLKRLGYMLGRWVYIVDAVDDLQDDIKKNTFNPFKFNVTDMTSMQQKELFFKYAGEVLSTTAGEAVLAFELLETNRFRDIIENVMFDGLTKVADKVLEKYRRCSIERSI